MLSRRRPRASRHLTALLGGRRVMPARRLAQPTRVREASYHNDFAVSVASTSEPVSRRATGKCRGTSPVLGFESATPPVVQRATGRPNRTPFDPDDCAGRPSTAPARRSESGDASLGMSGTERPCRLQQHHRSPRTSPALIQRLQNLRRLQVCCWAWDSAASWTELSCIRFCSGTICSPTRGISRWTP